jgi:hypothetical protein
MKFREVMEDEGVTQSAPVTTMSSDDIAKFGCRIGAKKGKKPPILEKPLVNWRKNRMEIESGDPNSGFFPHEA